MFVITPIDETDNNGASPGLNTGQRAAAALEAHQLLPPEDHTKLFEMGPRFNVSRTSIQRILEVYRMDKALYQQVKEGAISMEGARRRLGLWRPTRPKGENLVPRDRWKLTVARKERADRIRILASEGHVSAQIADIEHLHIATVRKIARDYMINLPDNNTRRKQSFNVNRAVEQALFGLANVEMVTGLIRDHIDYIDHAQIPEWLAQFRQYRRSISEMITVLRKEGYEKNNGR